MQVQWQWQHPEGFWYGFPQEQQSTFANAAATGSKKCIILIEGTLCEANLVENYIMVQGVRYQIRAADAHAEYCIQVPLSPRHFLQEHQQRAGGILPGATTSPSRNGKIRGWGDWAACKVDGVATGVERQVQDRTDRALATNYRDINANPDKNLPSVVRAGGAGLTSATSAVASAAESVAGVVDRAGIFVGKKIAPSDPNGVLVQSCDAYITVMESLKDGTVRVVQATANGAQQTTEAKHGKQCGDLVGQLGQSGVNLGKTFFAVKDVVAPVKGVARGVVRGVSSNYQPNYRPVHVTSPIPMHSPPPIVV